MKTIIYLLLLANFCPWYINYMNKKIEHGTDVKITFYYPRPQETDSSPCIGALGINQCEGAKEGKRYVALSRDLLKNYPYKSFIRLQSSDWDCAGIFQVVDTTNVRLQKTADIFDPIRLRSKSCSGTIYPYHF